MVDPSFNLLRERIGTIPAGRWGVAVSGGADSVCLLRLAACRGDLHLRVLHLDHETRGEASTGDARFVADLAVSLQLPATLATASQIEWSLAAAAWETLPTNRSSRFRVLRLALYRAAIAEHQLQGVLLAHHADDQAETVLLRLIRGGAYTSLSGMADRTTVGGVCLLRPLLEVPREMLRDYLRHIDQPWREDASNASENQARNRVRKVLGELPAMSMRLCEIATNCRRLADWAACHAPALSERFAVRTLWNVPEILATAALGNWLRQRGVPADAISSEHLRDLFTLCTDAASPPRIVTPGNTTIRRSGGSVFMDSPAQT